MLSGLPGATVKALYLLVHVAKPIPQPLLCTLSPHATPQTKRRVHTPRAVDETQPGPRGSATIDHPYTLWQPLHAVRITGQGYIMITVDQVQARRRVVVQGLHARKRERCTHGPECFALFARQPVEATLTSP